MLLAVATGWVMDISGQPLFFAIFIICELAALVILWGLPNRLVEVRVAEKATGALAGLRAMFTKRIVLCLGAALFAAFAAMTYFVFLSIYLDTLRFDDSMKGLAWGVAIVAEIALLLTAGRFIERYGCRWLILIGLGGVILRSSIYAFVSIRWVAFLASSLHALTFAAVHIGAVHFLTDEAPKGRNGAVQLLLSATMWGIGGAIGSLMAGYLAAGLGYRGMYAVSIVFGVIGMVIFLPLLKDRRPSAETDVAM
jgi:PPP family 3-phenylpropionic acid transporter